MNRKRNRSTALVALVVLVCFAGCDSGSMSFKDAITEENLKPTVSRVLDSQMEYIKPQLDQELQDLIDGEGAKAGTSMTGSQIVELTLKEQGGRDYLDFCYAVNTSLAASDMKPVLDTAKDLLSDEEYDDLLQQADELERSIGAKGLELAKGIPTDQQEDFYKDLKLMVTRAVVLLAAGIVYAVIPDVVLWGKVSAAAAISIGAGMVSISIMSLYQYYRYGGSTAGKTFEGWLQELYEIPAADYALTTTIVTMATSMNLTPVVTGIIMCVFAVYKTTEMFLTMRSTYNFDA